MIRLLQEDVLSDKNDWMDKLKTCIDTIDRQPYYFLCANGEYVNHEMLLQVAQANVQKEKLEPTGRKLKPTSRKLVIRGKKRVAKTTARKK